MVDSTYNYESSKFQDNFKTTFDEGTEIALNLATPYRARTRTTHDFTGSDKTGSVSLSLGGGRGSGSTLPASNQRTVKKKIVSKVETYGRYVIDRPTLIAGSDDKGSFRRSDKLAVKGVVDSVNLNLERMCFAQDSLGTIASFTGSGPWVLTISDATWIPANFLLGDYVNIGTGDTDQFEVTAINLDAKTVTVARISGSQTPANSDEIFLQNSEGEEAIGYADAFDTGVTSLFNITKQYGWQAQRVDAQSNTISDDYLADAMIEQQQRVGMSPSEIHASVRQFKNLHASNPDPQYYIGVAKHGEYKMKYKGLSLLSPVASEEIPVLLNRFILDTKVYMINTEESEIAFAPEFGWFQEGPKRISGTTKYEYPFGGEWAHEFHPSYQTEIHTLAV